MSSGPAGAFGSSSQTPKWCYDDTVMLRTRWSHGAAPEQKPPWKSSMCIFASATSTSFYMTGRQWRKHFQKLGLQWFAGQRSARVVSACRLFSTTKNMIGKVYMSKRSNPEPMELVTRCSATARM